MPVGLFDTEQSPLLPKIVSEEWSDNCRGLWWHEKSSNFYSFHL